MNGNRFPGKEEERSSFRTAPFGLLEPWSQQENDWCDGQPHGFASWPCRKEGCTYLQERILLQRFHTAGHLQRLRGAALHFDKDPFEAPAEVKHLVVSWTFAINENKKADWTKSGAATLVAAERKHPRHRSSHLQTFPTASWVSLTNTVCTCS